MNAFTSLSFCFVSFAFERVRNLKVIDSILQVVLATASPPCGTGYGQIPCPVVQYVPAKPGQTPSCAMKDSTFCETIPDYPTWVWQAKLCNTADASIVCFRWKFWETFQKRSLVNNHCRQTNWRLAWFASTCLIFQSSTFSICKILFEILFGFTSCAVEYLLAEFSEMFARTKTKVCKVWKSASNLSKYFLFPIRPDTSSKLCWRTWKSRTCWQTRCKRNSRRLNGSFPMSRISSVTNRTNTPDKMKRRICKKWCA